MELGVLGAEMAAGDVLLTDNVHWVFARFLRVDAEEANGFAVMPATARPWNLPIVDINTK